MSGPRYAFQGFCPTDSRLDLSKESLNSCETHSILIVNCVEACDNSEGSTGEKKADF